VYPDFIAELCKRGVLRSSQKCCGRVGAFAVSKKPKVADGNLIPRQRLVLDCRMVNGLFRPSPHTNLGSLTALSEMSIPDGQKLFISGADIKGCFYAVRVEEALSDYSASCKTSPGMKFIWPLGVNLGPSIKAIFILQRSACYTWGSVGLSIWCSVSRVICLSGT
jgi:hypothetical protein